LEADLTCLYKPSTWGDRGTYVIHAECKSLNRFERRDTERMKELAIAFPGAALVFATLNGELQESEVKLIRSLAVAERKKRLHRKPSSHVILLTGTELFSHDIGENWRKKGGLYERFSQGSFELTKLDVLADATQQLYLRLPSYFEWLNTEWEKRRQRQARRKAETQKAGH